MDRLWLLSPILSLAVDPGIVVGVEEDAIYPAVPDKQEYTSHVPTRLVPHPARKSAPPTRGSGNETVPC